MQADQSADNLRASISNWQKELNSINARPGRAANRLPVKS